MADRFDFSKLDATDGWKVIAIEGDCYCSLSLELHVGTVSQVIGPDGVTFITLHEWKDPTPEDKADYARMRRLAEALCRYFTAGGSWDVLNTVLYNCEHYLGPSEYAGWHYHDLLVNGDAMYQHVFISAAGPPVGVVWVENVAIDRPEPWDQVENRLYYGEETGGAAEEEYRAGGLLPGGDPEEA